MPPLLILFGIIVLVSGIRGSQDELAELLKSEFQGDGTNPGFGAIATGVGGSAALGYVPGLEKFSNILTFMVFFSIVAANLRVQNNPFARIQQFVVNADKSTDAEKEVNK